MKPGRIDTPDRDSCDKARLAPVVLQLDPQAAHVAVDHVAFGDEVDSPERIRICSRVDLTRVCCQQIQQACSRPDRCSSDVPARTWRLRISISISPILITGLKRTDLPMLRRVMTIFARAAPSGEIGIVIMSSTPRSNAANFVRRSPRRVNARIGRRSVWSKRSVEDGCE